MNSLTTNREHSCRLLCLNMQAILALFVALLTFSCGSTKEQQAKREELRRLAASMPKFPDFQQINYSDIVKDGEIVVTYFYESSSSYDQVKSFYTKVLNSQGWNSLGEEANARWFEREGTRRLIFRKGMYIIYVNYDADAQASWRFAIDYRWERAP